MAKRVGQIRWFKDNSAFNSPSTVSSETLGNGTAFPRTYPIVQLGIQTLPGTKVYLNSHNNPIVIGATGIYELSVDGLAYLTSITFANDSLTNIAKNDQAYLIVDYIYETE